MSKAWSKKDWKRYAKDLEGYFAARIEQIKERGFTFAEEKSSEHWTVLPKTPSVRTVTVPEKWVAALILDLRKHYVDKTGQPPTYIFLPAIYLEKLLHELPPGTLHGEMMVFGITIVTKSPLAPTPFEMWE